MLQISIALFQTASSTRFSSVFTPFFFSSPPAFAHCHSLSSCLVFFIRIARITPGWASGPYNRSLPRCARGFHIKESYLLMRRNYPAHNGRRQHATVKSVEGVESKRWERVEFVRTVLLKRDMGVPHSKLSSFDGFKRSS